ncbi:hypothetical protein [Methylibium petroleiphilum]|uniref:Uncharacterized protein n=1 Tax=Methylibium petroleiphilum (strain ATCC BAA-1232 / LMG 22953 / PM1) TaxID=420662 RepID=A2SNF5_METPP|nr:hypothetical protein [Methylibium petroleiphilum]ABM97094.1 hypothetical protein Mpe_B0319 [Methylibium petroleiphilum PM1]
MSQSAPPQPAAAPLQQSPIQRRYYWSIIRHAARATLPAGTPVQAQKYLHNEFKEQILGLEEVRGADGVVALQAISTTSLDHAEFSDYIEAVLSILADAGIDMPDRPEDLLEICPRDLPEPLPRPKRRPRK